VKTLVFFNNKGGVGKTTLACNVVSYLNLRKNKRALLIDADPQCNATQAMLGDDVLQDVYLTGSESISLPALRRLIASSC
jgi:cellulose biosynthesis protein BcsQ